MTESIHDAFTSRGAFSQVSWELKKRVARNKMVVHADDLSWLGAQSAALSTDQIYLITGKLAGFLFSLQPASSDTMAQVSRSLLTPSPNTQLSIMATNR